MNREEAINEIKSWAISSKKGREVLETLIPELRESEDEEIRKDIIGGLMWQRDNLKSEGPHDNNLILPGFCFTVGKHLTYLEKQKEQTENATKTLAKILKDSAEGFRRILKKKGIDYEVSDEFWENTAVVYSKEEDIEFHKWKDDLMGPTPIEETYEYKKGLEAGMKQKEPPFVKDVVLGYPGHYFYDGERMHFCGSPAMEEKQKEQKPVENPFDANETMKMKDRIDEGFTKMMMQEQKPAEWSEEDEKIVKFYEDDYDNNLGNMPMRDVIENRIKFKDWLLNRLKFIRPQPKPAWSEEDEKIMQTMIKEGDLKPSEIAWLKSLRPPKDCSDCSKHLQGYIDGRGDAENKLLEMYGILLTPDGELRMKPRWKPGEEQMKALEVIVRYGDKESTHIKSLRDLYEHLKKL